MSAPAGGGKARPDVFSKLPRLREEAPFWGGDLGTRENLQRLDDAEEALQAGTGKLKRGVKQAVAQLEAPRVEVLIEALAEIFHLLKELQNTLPRGALAAARVRSPGKPDGWEILLRYNDDAVDWACHCLRGGRSVESSGRPPDSTPVSTGGDRDALGDLLGLAEVQAALHDDPQRKHPTSGPHRAAVAALVSFDKRTGSTSASKIARRLTERKKQLKAALTAIEAESERDQKMSVAGSHWRSRFGTAGFPRTSHRRQHPRRAHRIGRGKNPTTGVVRRRFYLLLGELRRLGAKRASALTDHPVPVGRSEGTQDRLWRAYYRAATRSAIDLLVEAKDRGLLPAIGPVLDLLERSRGFRLSAGERGRARSLCGE